MPPKPKPSKGKQPQPIPGTSQEMQVSTDHHDDIKENGKETLEEMRIRNECKLKTALCLLEIRELTPNQVEEFYSKIREMRMRGDFGVGNRRENNIYRAGKPAEVDVTELEFHDVLTSYRVWKTVPVKNDECNVMIQDPFYGSVDTDYVKTSPKKSKKSKVVCYTIPKTNYPDVDNLLKRIIVHIKTRRFGKLWEKLTDQEKKKAVTRAELLDVLYFQAGLLVETYSEQLQVYFRLLPAATVKDLNRHEIKKMLIPKKTLLSRLPPSELVIYPRLFNLIVKLSLEILEELNEEDGNALVEILSRESNWKEETTTEGQTSDKSDSTANQKPDDVKIEVEAKEEREAKTKALPSNEVAKEDLVAESLSAGEAGPLPQQKAAEGKATPPPFESEVSSPTKGLKRDRSPSPGESPLKKMKK